VASGPPPGPDATRRFEPADQGPDDLTRRLERPPGDDRPVLAGRYRLDGLLGAGGMAEVHRATDLRLNRSVAVKIFRPDTDPDAGRRFDDEARTLANLSHPGLVAVHDYGVERGRAYLVMELVVGPTLRQVFERETLTPQRTARIGADVAEVLAYVHAKGVVHRDVKPSNILLGHDDRVRLADFGIARLAGASGMTSERGALGTPAYMAPEHVQGEPVGPPADVYALGLVLLEALTGHPEYPGETWEAASARLTRPPEVPADVPEPLRGTVHAMTETDPAERPTARQVADALRAPARVVEPVAEPTGRRWWPLAAALAVVALLVLAFVAFGGEDPADTADQAAPTAEPTVTEEPAAGPTEDPAEDPADGFPEPPSFDPSGLPDLPDVPTDLPDIPTDLPDIPTDLPDVPELPDGVADDARGLWQRFVDWFSGLF